MRDTTLRTRLALCLSACLAILGAGVGLLPLVTVWWLASQALAGDLSRDAVVLSTACAALAIVGKAVLLSASTAVSHMAAFGHLARLREEAIGRIGALPQAVIDARGTADLRRLVVEDIEQIEDSLAHAVPDLAQGIAVPVLVLGILLPVDWRLALAAVAMFPLLGMIYPMTVRATRVEYGRWYGSLAELKQAARQLIGGMAVIRSFVGAGRGVEAFVAAVDQSRQTGFAAGTASLVQMSLLYTGLRGNVLVLVPVGATLWLAGQVTASDVVLFLLLGLGLNASILRLIFTAGNFSWRMKSARARIEWLRGLEPFPVLVPETVPRGSAIGFSDVGLAVDGRKVLDGVTLSVPEGGTLAIVGPSGAGKSTILRLAMRVTDPDQGVVTLGAVDLRQIGASALSEQISAVLQDAWLADTSLRENIRSGRPAATDQEVEEAARLAQVMGFAARHPLGLDMPAGEAGRNLSGGERQRVGIARAMLRDAPVLLLDEATAALDPESEEEVLAGLEVLKRGRTVIVVAHRLHTIRNAEQIAVMEAGRLVDCGKHADLQARCPLYARLWAGYEDAAGWHLPGGAVLPVPLPTPPRTRDAGNSAPMPSAGWQRWLWLAGEKGQRALRRAVPFLALEGFLMGAPVLVVCACLHLLLSERLTLPGALALVTVLLMAALMQILVNQRGFRHLWQVQTEAVAALQNRLADHLRRVPLMRVLSRDSTGLEEVITRHAAAINFVIPPAQIAKAMTGPLLSMAVLLWLDWRFAILALLGLAPILMVLQWSERVNRQIWFGMVEANARLSARLTEWLDGLPTLRSLGLLPVWQQRLVGVVADHRQTSRQTLRILVPLMMTGWIAVDLGFWLMLAGGAVLVAAGTTSPETWLLAVVAGLIFHAPMGDLFELSAHMGVMRRSMDRVAEVLALPELPEPACTATLAGLDIRLEKVGFSRDGRPVLAGVTAEFRAGGIHAIAGPSGSGKSTLLALIARLMDPDEGRITIGGVDLRQIGPELRERLFSVMFQQAFLFDDTVETNLRIARPDATSDELTAAARAARCHDFIMNLPEGYQTRLGGKGAHLSGGERQRIALARALLKDAPIILLDEATASVDPENECEIREAMAAACRGRTVIVIAHRPETLRNVDSVLELERPMRD